MRPHLLCAAALLGLLAACQSTSPPQDPAPEVDAEDPRDLSADASDAADAQDLTPDPQDLAQDSQVDMGDGAPRLCQSHYQPPTEAGSLGERLLVESSGLTTSLRDPEVLWLHNDSGDQARLYAVGTDGRALARLNLPGVQARDLEDIDVAPCPHQPGPCLWVADTGDNDQEREEVTLYAVPEPALSLEDAPLELSAQDIAALPLRYPGGPVDVEALMLSPQGDQAWLLEKVDGARARLFLYQGPFSVGATRQVQEVATFDAPGAPIRRGKSITGADMHPSGERFLLRVYTGTYEYRLGPGQTPADIASVTPIVAGAGPLSEPQGEAVCYGVRGDEFWTVSEDTEGEPGQPLHHYRCADEAP